MDPHGIHLEGRRKEISCSDCGHAYLIALGQQSSRCSVCGNIEYIAAAAGAVLQGFVPQPQEEAASPLDLFAHSPDGARVEELRMRYQVEWQLWSMLVKNFRDPCFHAAYLSQALEAGTLDQAANRYREHRSAMVLVVDDSWQAAVADLMLARLENLTAVRMEAEGRSRPRVLEWLLLLPNDSRLLRIAWSLIGMLVVARLFHVL